MLAETRLITASILAATLFASTPLQAQELRGPRIGSGAVAGSANIDRWAVIIGVADYEDPTLDLEYADDDAEALADFLMTPEGGGFPEQNVQLLTNADADLLTVQRTLRSFLQKPAREDFVVIFFAGHGAADPVRPENLYFLTHDTDRSDFAGTALPMDELLTNVERQLLAERVLVLVDACHSAGIQDRFRLVDDPAGAVNAYLQRLSEAKPGLAMLTSAETRQTSREGARWRRGAREGHGVFTYHLLQGLEGAADGYESGEPDRFVTTGELFEYVRDAVRRDTENAQHPAIGAASFDRSMPVSIASGSLVSALQSIEASSVVELDQVPALADTEQETLAQRIQSAYSQDLRERGASGVAGVRVVIDEAGSVLEQDLVTRTGFSELDEIALQIVSGVTFVPAVRRGVPVSSTFVLPLVFSDGPSGTVEALDAAGPTAAFPPPQSCQRVQPTSLDRTYNELVTLAGQRLAEGRLEESARLFGQVLRARPDRAPDTAAQREELWIALYRSGAQLVNDGNYPEAITAYDHADLAYGDRPEIKVILGQLYAQGAYYDCAISLLRAADAIVNSGRIVDMDPATAASWRDLERDVGPTLVYALAATGQWSTAARESAARIRTDATGAYTYVSLGVLALEKTGGASAVVDFLSNSLELGGFDRRTYFQIGVGLYKAAAYYRAASAFERAAELSVNDRDALELAVNSLQLTYQGTDSPEAPVSDVQRWINMAERWIALDPANPSAWIALAQGTNKSDDLSEASEVPTLLDRAQMVPVQVQELQLSTADSGEVSVSGLVRRGTLDSSSVDLEFTFFDATGRVITTELVRVSLSDGADAATPFEISVSAGPVEGYGYVVR